MCSLPRHAFATPHRYGGFGRLRLGERTARLYRRPQENATRGAIELETNREMIRGWQQVPQSSPRHISRKTAIRNADHSVIARMIRGEGLWIKRDGCPSR